MCSEGYSTWSVCVSVCLSSVSSYSRTTGYKAAHERYQCLQNYVNLKNKWSIFLKGLRSRDMPWKQVKKPIWISHQLTSTNPLALCTLRRHKKSPRRPCIDSRISMLSYSYSEAPRPTSVETTSKHILIAQPINLRCRTCVMCRGFHSFIF